MSDRYEIVDSGHGEGGFGKVSKQRDMYLERLVAVKSLKMLDDDESRERFIREAKTLARMSHPNIPTTLTARPTRHDPHQGEGELSSFDAHVDQRPVSHWRVAFRCRSRVRPTRFLDPRELCARLRGACRRMPYGLQIGLCLARIIQARRASFEVAQFGSPGGTIA